MSRGQDVRAMFSKIARTYDLLNTVLSFGRHHAWRREFAAELLAGLGERPVVLEVCAGTGDTALACTQRCAHCRVVGIDFSQPMLAVFLKKAARRGVSGRTLVICADALRLPVAGGSCDAVACTWGARNLSDLAAGVREMWRCLRPGGRLGVIDFFRPEANLAHCLASWYVKLVIPPLGGLLSRDLRAYAYLPGSIARFASRGEFAELLKGVGFENIRTREMTLGVATLFFAEKPAR